MPQFNKKQENKKGLDDQPTKLTQQEIEQTVVTYEKSVTKKFGDNNYIKVSISATVPINPSKQLLREIDATVEVLDPYFDHILEDKITAITDQDR